MDILNRIDIVLNETRTAVKKGIYSQDGRKIEGSRQSKMLLAIEYDDGTVDNVTWKQFKDSKLPWVGGQETRKQEFLMKLISQEKQFNKKVEYNSWVRKNQDVEWEVKVDQAMNMMSVKYAKAGMSR
jgi:hypothetical protein